jgi:arylsulfate sulfotransferase
MRWHVFLNNGNSMISFGKGQLCSDLAIGRPVALLLGLLACSQAVEAQDAPALTLNPNGTTPLAAVLELTTSEPSRVTLSIDDGSTPYAVVFPETSTDHLLPVLGLKPNSSYVVTATAFSGTAVTARAAFSLQTDPLPPEFPSVQVVTSTESRMEPGFTLIDRFRRRRTEEPAETYSAIFDAAGEVVWYSNSGGRATRRLANGHLMYFVDNSMVESDLLGNQTVVPLQDPGLGLHHDLFPTEHGTLLSLSRTSVEIENYPSSETDPDAPRETAVIRDEPVVEFSMSGEVINVWPLVDMLDPTRIGYDSLNSTPQGLDWVHTNAVLHDPSDDSIIVSVRHQDAVIKFDRTTGELKWILGPHDNWAPEFQRYLLQPVGEAYESPYHTHAPMLTPNGTLLLFDNGNYRTSPWDGLEPMPASDSYSRAVEYAIDEDRMQVTQVWQHGFGSSPRLYSNFVSDADWLPETGNVLINYGGLSFTDGVRNSELGWGLSATRIVEVDRESPANVVFDMILYNPDPARAIIVYRAERISSLYADGVVIGSDADSDGVLDSADNCPGERNPSQGDQDGDGLGNVCDDSPFGGGGRLSPGFLAALLLMTVSGFAAARIRPRFDAKLTEQVT